MENPQIATTIAATTAFDNHRQSVVQIVGVSINQQGLEEKKFHGSGFIIHNKVAENRCLVITCEHVLADLAPGAQLCVRLCGTSVDLPAERLYSNAFLDLAVVRVVAPDVNNLPCLVLSTDAKPAGTLVALVSYYHPIDLSVHIKIDGDVLADVPGSIGGYIEAPSILEKNGNHVIPCSCYGIRGTSGGPLICHFSQKAIGVYTLSSFEIHYATAAITVMKFLGMWLQQNNLPGITTSDTLENTIGRCADIY